MCILADEYTEESVIALNTNMFSASCVINFGLMNYEMGSKTFAFFVQTRFFPHLMLS